MDKLKPLLEHKFWILYAVVLIMPPVGWWMISGEMSMVIAERTGSIEKSFSTASQTASKAKIPNDGWTEQVKAISEQQRADLKRTTYGLWKIQWQLMTWPEQMQEFMGELKFRGIPDTRDKRLNASHMFGRGQGYRDSVVRLKQLLDPYDVREQTGKIVVSNAAWPVQETKYEQQTRTRFPDIWNEMEDLWLLRDLFQAIDRVNRDANTLNEANIKELRKLTLHGGTAESAAASGGILGMSSAPRTTTFNNSASFRLAAQANFAPTSVFGPPPEPTDGKPYDKRPRDRFVHFGPGSPFVTRGFYMELIMDHRQVPELVAQLTKSSWPVEIKRIQVAELTDQARKAGKGPAAKADDDAEAEGLQIVASAMEDPYLALVSVAGLMMLFNPVEPPPETLAAETVVAESADEAAAVTPETDVDSADAEASEADAEDPIAEDDSVEDKPAEDEPVDAEEPDPAAGQDSPEQPQ